jgi:peptidase M42 family hydrolase
MKHIELDTSYLEQLLLRLLCIHSPTGYTDPIVREVCDELDKLKIPFELTRRGAIRATLSGRAYSPDRAIVTHLDTLGAMVKRIKPNGRLEVVPVGTWSARFAEGARISVYTDKTVYRGTVLPLMASGHTFNDAIDHQPSTWENLEVRVDELIENADDAQKRGINVGDYVGVDARPEILQNGFINARHLDDKAGVATLLTAAKYVVENKIDLPVDCHLIFTISEEVGSGASAILHGDVAEMVSVDNGTVAPGQNSSEHGVTVAIADSSGPFDYHLTHHLLNLCRKYELPHQRDVFRYYRCDSASALEAGNDIRTALVTFGVDASHGYERTHLGALENIGKLLVGYVQNHLIYRQQKEALGSLSSFPKTRKTDVPLMQVDQTESVSQVPPRSPRKK